MDPLRDDAECIPARGRAGRLEALEQCGPTMFHELWRSKFDLTFPSPNQ